MTAYAFSASTMVEVPANPTSTMVPTSAILVGTMMEMRFTRTAAIFFKLLKKTHHAISRRFPRMRRPCQLLAATRHAVLGCGGSGCVLATRWEETMVGATLSGI